MGIQMPMFVSKEFVQSTDIRNIHRHLKTHGLKTDVCMYLYTEILIKIICELQTVYILHVCLFPVILGPFLKKKCLGSFKIHIYF